MELKERLMKRVRVAQSGCWEWQGAITQAGYGTITVNAKTKYTHRISYRLFAGPIPDGLVIDHLCRNRKCCNPEHLEPVTNRENLARGEARTSPPKAHCLRGHEYTAENTRRNAGGTRSCIECARTRARERYRARTAAENTADTILHGTFSLSRVRHEFCAKGHPIFEHPRSGHRWCKTCESEQRRQKWRAAHPLS